MKGKTTMAIYHLEAKVISRGVGRSAVAASAYMSCSKIYNEYDGMQHDYTRKQGLVYEQVFLPPQAPTAWKDRDVLWNAVEEAEKTKDSRLAREFVVSLPIELSKEENISLLTEYVQKNFVNDGMCADICIHDTDGHNLHAHIMLTVRSLDENGKRWAMTQKEYYVGLRETHGIQFDTGTASESLAQTDKMLGEDLYSQKRSILEKLRRLKYEQKRTERNRKHRGRNDGDFTL